MVATGSSNGRKAIIDEGIILDLSKLFNDSEVLARKNAHMTVEMMSEMSFGAQGIVDLRLIRTLVGKQNEELDEIKVSLRSYSITSDSTTTVLTSVARRLS